MDFVQEMQLHTKACLEYATRLQVNTGKSTMGSDYVKHETANMYQPLPTGGLNSDNIKTPFAKNTSKYFKFEIKIDGFAYLDN